MYPTTPRTGRVAFIATKRRSERRAMSSGGCLGFGESYTKRALDSRQQNSSVTKPIVVVGLDNGRAKRPRVGERSTRRIIRPELLSERGAIVPAEGKIPRLARRETWIPVPVVAEEVVHAVRGTECGPTGVRREARKWRREWKRIATYKIRFSAARDDLARRSRATLSRVDVAPLSDRTIEEGGFPDRAELF